MPFILFLLVVLCGLGYVLWHVWHLIPLPHLVRWAVVVLMAASFLGIFLLFGRKLEAMPMGVASVAYDVCTSALMVMLYLLMIFIVLDVLRLVHLLPHGYLHDNWAATLAVAGLVTVVFGYGHLHYLDKVRVPLELTTGKALAKDYKIVMLSDLHLGYHNRRAEFARWVDMINAEHPDLILVAGDIIDISVRPLAEDGMAEEFRRIEAPVYACLGNHEYFSSEPRARQFYADAGIHLLSDSAAQVDSCITLIGRDDRTNPSRKSLGELMSGVSGGQYTIVLDHQPYHLEEAEQCGADFQLSGHTHRGQVWPISWVTDAVYECSWGEWQRGSTRYYVSSGMGIWGGKYRIGTQSEYVVATLKSAR